MVGKLSIGRLSVNKPSVNKTILILNAGGTIGMVAGRSGLVPSRRFTRQIEEWLGRRDELNCNHYVIDAVEPLIDSANAEPSTWHGIARRIWSKRDRIDGVVVLHGTDTLAYTAGALSFLLVNFGKPIILTGAQVPFSLPGSDGEANVRGALACAVDARIREVCIYFDGRLLRGNRARKWSTQSGDGFFSPHWPELGRIETKLRIAASALLSIAPAAEPAKPGKAGPISVGLLKLYPGISDRIISAAGDAHPDGLVLELYGSGTGPAKSKAIREALRALRKAWTSIPAATASSTSVGSAAIPMPRPMTATRLARGGSVKPRPSGPITSQRPPWASSPSSGGYPRRAPCRPPAGSGDRG